MNFKELKITLLLNLTPVCLFACQSRNMNEGEVRAAPSFSTLPAPGQGPWGMRSSAFLASSDDCRRVKGDVLEPGFKLSKSQSSSNCMETKFFRPVISLTSLKSYTDAGVFKPDNEKLLVLHQFGLDADDGTKSAVLANVGHAVNGETDGQFFTARIPLSAFDTAEAYYLIESFKVGPIAGSHGMMRFQFTSPVVDLYPQSGPDMDKIAAKTNGIVFSVHAIPAQNAGFDPLGAGMNSGMALGRGIYTPENKMADVIEKQKHTLQQIKLKLDSTQKRKFFETYVADGPNRFYQVPYHTLDNNCGTELLQVFADAFGMPKPQSFANEGFFKGIKAAMTGRMLPDIFPDQVRSALKDRNIYDSEAADWTKP